MNAIWPLDGKVLTDWLRLIPTLNRARYVPLEGMIFIAKSEQLINFHNSSFT